MGEFLAALRKSKGYTQQELAELVGVSNKTVSGWETGVSCPDISLLPVLAELYGVTCDELIRGERIPTGESPARTAQKRKKHLAHLLRGAEYRASAGLWGSVALAAAAALLTLILATAAFESRLGFFLGLILLLASALTVNLVCRYALLKVRQEEFEAEALVGFRRKIFFARLAAAETQLAAFGFIFPHVFAPAHSGLMLSEALLYGLATAAALLFLSVPVVFACMAGADCFDVRTRRFNRFRAGHLAVIFAVWLVLTVPATGLVSYWYANGYFSSDRTSYFFSTLSQMKRFAEEDSLSERYGEYLVLSSDDDGETRLYATDEIGAFGGYHAELTEEGVIVVLQRFRQVVKYEDGSATVVSFLVANEALQGRALRVEDSGQTPSRYELSVRSSYFGADAVALLCVRVWDASVTGAAVAVYLVRRKKFLRAESAKADGCSEKG